MTERAAHNEERRCDQRHLGVKLRPRAVAIVRCAASRVHEIVVAGIGVPLAAASLLAMAHTTVAPTAGIHADSGTDAGAFIYANESPSPRRSLLRADQRPSERFAGELIRR